MPGVDGGMGENKNYTCLVNYHNKKFHRLICKGGGTFCYDSVCHFVKCHNAIVGR